MPPPGPRGVDTYNRMLTGPTRKVSGRGTGLGARPGDDRGVACHFGYAISTSPVAVRAPASSANLGPGFGSLALALTRCDTATAQVGGTAFRVEISGEEAGELPADERHLVAETTMSVFDRLGGFQLICHNTIPQARGMGSSSAAIVAGILLARQFGQGGPGRLDEAAVVRLAAEREGHPDNVAGLRTGRLYRRLDRTHQDRPADAGHATGRRQGRGHRFLHPGTARLHGQGTRGSAC